MCLGDEIENGSEGSDAGEGGEAGGGEELSELQQEVADLEELGGEEPTDPAEVTVGGVNLGEEEEEGSDDEVEDRK